MTPANVLRRQDCRLRASLPVDYHISPTPRDMSDGPCDQILDICLCRTWGHTRQGKQAAVRHTTPVLNNFIETGIKDHGARDNGDDDDNDNGECWVVMAMLLLLLGDGVVDCLKRRLQLLARSGLHVSKRLRTT